MEKLIYITKDNVARLSNTEPFLMPDNLILSFKSNGYDLRNAFISLKNGEKKGQFKLSNPFVIEQDFLFAGQLDIDIRLYNDEGEIAKKWSVVPIKIKETEFGITGFDLLADLERRYEQFIEAFNALAESHNDLTDTVRDLQEGE